MVVNKSLVQSLQATSIEESTSEVASSSSSSSPATQAVSNSRMKSQFFHMNKKTVMAKPQLTFKDKIDNSHLPFVPKLRNKVNASAPLPDVFAKLDALGGKFDRDLFEANMELYDFHLAFLKLLIKDLIQQQQQQQ